MPAPLRPGACYSGNTTGPYFFQAGMHRAGKRPPGMISVSISFAGRPGPSGAASIDFQPQEPCNHFLENFKYGGPEKRRRVFSMKSLRANYKIGYVYVKFSVENFF
jgi:hypothetical protein